MMLNSFCLFGLTQIAPDMLVACLAFFGIPGKNLILLFDDQFLSFNFKMNIVLSQYSQYLGKIKVTLHFSSKLPRWYPPFIHNIYVIPAGNLAQDHLEV